MSRTKPGYATYLRVHSPGRKLAVGRRGKTVGDHEFGSYGPRRPQPWKARTRFRRADGGHRDRVGKGQQSTALKFEHPIAQHQLLKVVLQCEVARRAGAVL